MFIELTLAVPFTKPTVYEGLLCLYLLLGLYFSHGARSLVKADLILKC